MALKAVVTDIQSVPEAARSFYVERNGEHVLDVEAVEQGGKRWALEDVGGLKSALQGERAERERLAKIAADYGDVTPAKAREALDTAARLSKINPESEAAKLAEERVKSLTEQLEAKHRGEIEAHSTKLKKRETQLARLLKSEAIRRELLAHGAIAEDLDYLEFHAGKHVEMVETGDELVPRVVNEHGKELISMKPGSIDSMEIGELVKDFIRPKHQRHFVGENPSGSGSSQNRSANNNGGGGVRRISRGDQAAINANWQDIASGRATVV